MADSSPWRDRIEALAERDLERQLREVRGPVGAEVETADGPKLLFCTNDYLGLAGDPRLTAALDEGGRRWGAGAAASRLISGNTAAHAALERELERFCESEAAVVFGSGYHANLGALATLTGPGDAIFSDELVHASLIDGCRLSRAESTIYAHRDTDQLADLLSRSEVPGLKLVVTDAVFSMDGDVAPLARIVALAEEHGAHVYLDEAHSLGVRGPGGRGLAAELGLADRVAVRMGTLGKAFGLAGAFVACDREAARLLTSQARSLLYTTAQPAPVIEAARRSLEIVEGATELRGALQRNIDTFRQLAAGSGLPMIDSSTAIQPVLIGPAARTMEISRLLWEAGLFVQGIRPPTVAEGTCRLRVTLSAAHAPEDLERLVDALAQALSKTKETG